MTRRGLLHPTQTRLLLAATLSFAACDDGPVDPPPGCETKADCAANEVCAAASAEDPEKRCRAGECTSDAECLAKDPRKLCQLDTLSCAFTPPFGDDCDDARPCVFGEFCSTLLGTCHTSSTAADCTRRGQCPAGQTCDKGANKCVQDPGCYGDQFCEESEICDLVNHECTQVSIECSRCTSAGACTGNAVCDVISRECVAPGTEAACRTGEICDPLRRCVQCLNDDQCGPGTFCNAALGKCESNIQCVDDPSQCPMGGSVRCVTCEGLEICDRRTRQCQAPPTPCESDVDCGSGEFCDEQLDPPVCARRAADCLNDLLEPNDRAAEARALEGGPRFEELKVCPGDADWYRVDVEAGDYLTVDVRFRHADGDLEAQLFLADGVTLVDESRTTTDNERVELAAGTRGSFLLRVFLAVPAVNPTPYELVINRERGDACADDANEDDDTIGAAKPLGSDMAYDGRVCTADPDWFVIRSVPAATRITATLDVRASLGDLDLELWRASSSRPIAAARSSADDERITYDASFAGDYYVRVIGKRADSNVYTLRVDLRDQPELVCLDDRFEPNDAPPEATRAPEETMATDVPDMTLCGGDEDWFVVNLGPGEGIMADVGFDPRADVELKLYEPGAMSGSSAPVVSSASVNGREHVGWRAARTGDHYVRVHALDPTHATPYALHLERLPPLVCTDDFVDAQGRGDTQMDPFPLSAAPTRVDDLSLCFGDSDWYQLLLPGGFNNVIRLHYVESDAVLDMVVYDLTGAQLVATAGAGSSKEIAANVPGAGGIAAVNLQVLLASGFESPYNLTLDLQELQECEPDRAEPNELAEAPSLIASATTSPQLLEGLSLCATVVDPLTARGDDDWFELHPPRVGARIVARTISDSGDLFLELRSPGAARRACIHGGGDRCYSDRYELEEAITFTATTTQPYLLRVGSVYSDPNAQIRPIGSDTKYRLELEYR